MLVRQVLVREVGGRPKSFASGLASAVSAGYNGLTTDTRPRASSGAGYVSGLWVLHTKIMGYASGLLALHTKISDRAAKRWCKRVPTPSSGVQGPFG